MAEVSRKESVQQTALERLSKRIELWIAEGCAKVAVCVSLRPGRTVWVSVLCCLVLTLGWLNIDDEQQVEKLYTPQHTRAFRDRRWVESHFDDPASASAVLYEAETGKNLVSREALSELFDIYDYVLGIESEKGRRGYDERSCAKVYWVDFENFPERSSPQETCQKEGILAFWDWNRTLFENDDDLLATINRADKPDCCAPGGDKIVDLSSVASKLVVNDANEVVGIGALKLTFYLTTSLNSKSRLDPHNQRLENKFDRRLRGLRSANFKNALPLTSFGVGQNGDTSFDGDRTFINLAIIAIILYAYFALYDYARPEQSRAALGLGAVACVLLSTFAGFGVAMASGLTFSPSTGVAIFLVLGIGLDDSFVIAGAINEPYDDDELYDPTISPLENDALRVLDSGESIAATASKRVVHSLRTSGPSITVTSITDAAAFFAGSATRTPDIAQFNRFCGLAVLVDFVMQITFFVALLTFDQRRKLRTKIQSIKDQREKNNQPPKKGWLCRRFLNDRSRHESSPTSDDVPTREVVTPKESSSSSSSSSSDELSSEDSSPSKKEIALLERQKVDAEKKSLALEEGKTTIYADGDGEFWKTQYPKYLLSWPGKAFVLLASATILGLAIVGCLRFQADIDSDWTIVDYGEYRYARKAWDFHEKHFGAGASDWVGLYTKHADYYAHGDDMEKLILSVKNLGFVVNDSLDDNWYEEHQRWLLSTNRTVTSQSEWRASLEVFLETDEGQGFVKKIAFENGVVVGAEIDTRWKSEDVSGISNMRRMREARKTVRDHSGNLGTVIVYNDQFVWHESFAFVAASTITSLLIAVSTVFLVLLLLLGDVLAALFVTLFVADVCVCTLGSVYWYDDGVNYITAFFIVIAVGLSADAPAHLCRAYLDSRRPTRQERATDAIAKLGPSVFKGGVSTIVGIAITGFCITYVFITFFRYLMVILLLSLFNGLAVMPVLLSLIGPMPNHAIASASQHEKKKETTQEQQQTIGE